MLCTETGTVAESYLVRVEVNERCRHVSSMANQRIYSHWNQIPRHLHETESFIAGIMM